RQVATHHRDPAVLDEDVEDAVPPVHRIDEVPTLQQPVHQSPSAPPASRYSTAIRTATPLAPCSRITEYGPSATSDAISTPRFIGPGCMMITSGLARATRPADIPKVVKYSLR